jgi:tetratricopeptide (TPR) repeat protein
LRQFHLLLCSILLLAAFVFCFFPGTALGHDHKDSEPDDVGQARQWIEQGLDHFKDVKITDQYISFSDGKKTNVIVLPRTYWTNYTRTMIGGRLCNLVQWKDYSTEPLIGFVQEHYSHGDEKHLERFKAALDYLAAAAHESVITQQEALFERFKEQGKAWREAAAKPVMPEAAREHRVLAEYAFKQKDTDKAIAEYNAALEIFPTWPEGQFNLATLAGEKKLYGSAILHMKEYLELVPGSDDAQASKDSIIIWKDKLNAYFPEVASSESTPQLKKVSAPH